MTTATSETVMAKLQELQEKHALLGNNNRPFGVDTLCFFFSVRFDAMVAILTDLARNNMVRLEERTLYAKRTARSKVMYVSLL